MKTNTQKILDDLLQGNPPLTVCRQDIENAFLILQRAFDAGGKLLVCGNGGSAADSEHIVGELMKGFKLKRSLPKEQRDKLYAAFAEDGQYLAGYLQGALPAVSLVSQSALAYAFINDVAPDMVFAQQVFGYGRPGDVLFGLSTSGSARNVVNAVKVAKAFGLATVGLTGESGGDMCALCDVTVRAPASETYRIQECHLPMYHALCAMVEEEMFG